MKRYAANQTELARFLGVNIATITKWANLGAPAKAADRTTKGYNVAAVRRWADSNGYGSKAKVGQRPTLDGAGKALREAQADERRFRARIAELELKRLEGELIEIAEVEAHDRRRHEYMLGMLENWARSLGPELAGKTALEINRIMVGKVQDVMREFAGR